MNLYIAEKPSLGRAIADVLPKPHQKREGYIEVGNGDRVSWCIGHLLEQAEPDDYDPRFKKWSFDSLPIVPQKWQLKAKPKTRKQLTILKKLIQQAGQLIHAGDPDREGQLLVDEVIEHAGISEQKKHTTKRLLISDLNPASVRKALSNLKSNQEFVPLSVSALARSRADWLFGMNLTRAFTLAGQKAGYHGVLSVGRVQTPVLGLVVRRELEIEQFVSKPFYEVIAHLKTERGELFTAKWQPSQACEPYMDEEGRVLHKGLAENVINRISDQPANVKKVEKKQKKQFAPLPYNLSALQIDAAKAFSMSAKQVLDICQGLYEKHKLITYPRSDNRYLPIEHYADRYRVTEAIKNNEGQKQALVEAADLNLNSKCWNDKKVEAHHAIIPTAKKLKTAVLGYDEQRVYQLICRQYLAQFFPPHQYHETKVAVDISGGVFLAKAKQTLDWGFKVLFSKPNQAATNTRGTDYDQESSEQELPSLTVGQALHCEQGELLEKMTQPPAFFNDATLLSAMTGIARFVSEPEIKKVLKETDGLGTEATRAGIIDLLFQRQFIRREGKKIRATDSGKALISVLPEQVTWPDMTARWEASLNDIAHKHLSYPHFINPLESQLGQLIEQAKVCDTQVFKSLPHRASKFKKKKNFRRKKKTVA